MRQFECDRSIIVIEFIAYTLWLNSMESIVWFNFQVKNIENRSRSQSQRIQTIETKSYLFRARKLIDNYSQQNY